jgi:glycosyltransferase involved in cell wall biosynthesis
MLVARSWSQRGNNTDFQHFFQFFPDSINITNTTSLTFDNIIYRKLKAIANHDGYSSLSVALELEVLKKSLIHYPKLIHFWFADHDYHFSSYTAKLIGAKLIGNFFFSIDEFEYRMPEKKHLKHLDLITASGKKQMEYLSSFIPDEKIVFLPLGIDTEFYKPAISQICSGSDQPTILHVGSNRRDFKTLKKVFILVQKEIPNIKFELVGGKKVEEMFSEIENITFHPFVTDNDLLKIYQHASLLILPLLEGGSSQTLNEAMATGLPVITNDIPNLEDYILKGTALLSPQGDAESMAYHCCNLLKNRKLWDEMSQKARKHSKKFDFKEIRKKLINIYREYLNIEITGES